MTFQVDDEHDCGWKAYAKHQEAKLAEVQQKLAARCF